MINNDEIVARLSEAVDDIALMYANEPDALFVKAIKQMRIALTAGFNAGLFPDIPETKALVGEILQCAAIQRRDLELGAGYPGPARTLH